MFRRDVPLPERVFKGPGHQSQAPGPDVAKFFEPEVPCLIASTVDPDKPGPELAASPYLRGVLRLQFHDVGEPGRFQETPDVAMTPEHARQMLSSVRECLPEVVQDGSISSSLHWG